MSSVNEQYDVVIIGAGIAGLSCALELSKRSPTLKIAIVSKSTVDSCNSVLAQGGVAAVIDNENDSFDLHSKDTQIAGNFFSNPDVVEHIVNNAPRQIEWLLSLGVPFRNTTENTLALRLEGGHSRNRIVYTDDLTGKSIHDVLLNNAKLNEAIYFLEHHELLDLVSEANTVSGVVLWKDNAQIIVQAQIVVLATGGCGQLFEFTTNSKEATGDPIAIACKHGARTEDLDFIQFHPTAFFEVGKKKLFLLTEALRGEGARIVNHFGERFVLNYDKRGELAPRDVVSGAIFSELEKTYAPYAFLDCSGIAAEKLEVEFPMILKYCEERGLDIRVDLLPIVPAAHYMCGGIATNIHGESSVVNLFAVGECAHTGLHGNNRLASNSILEATVIGRNTAECIANRVIQGDVQIHKKPNSIWREIVYAEKEEILKIAKELSKIVQPGFTVENVDLSIYKLSKMYDELNVQQSEFPDSYYMLKNRLDLALMILKTRQKNLNINKTILSD
jgi:L-aspartate oxidase